VGAAFLELDGVQWMVMTSTCRCTPSCTCGSATSPPPGAVGTTLLWNSITGAWFTAMSVPRQGSHIATGARQLWLEGMMLGDGGMAALPLHASQPC